MKHKFQNIEDLTKEIRRYRKDTVITTGLRCLKDSLSLNSIDKNNHLTLAFSERILLLSLACGTIHRDKEMTEAVFRTLCESYWQLEQAEVQKAASSSEKEKFIDSMYKEIKKSQKKGIPIEYTKKKII